jgi:hypothetical protein
MKTSRGSVLGFVIVIVILIFAATYSLKYYFGKTTIDDSLGNQNKIDYGEAIDKAKTAAQQLTP